MSITIIHYYENCVQFLLRGMVVQARLALRALSLPKRCRTGVGERQMARWMRTETVLRYPLKHILPSTYHCTQENYNSST
ncbi:MAG: hypothetical protein ACSHX8_07460 [Opitutaceae bacterium]